GTVAVAAVFCESPDNPFAGFDETTSPPTLFVGRHTRRRVRVERRPAAGDVEFAVADPSVVKVALTGDGIVVGGERAGATAIRATAGGVALAELAVVGKGARGGTVNFFFVAHPSQPRLATS